MNKLALGAAAGIVALGVLWYVKDKLPGAIGDIGTAINPLNKENVFYTGANAIGAAASGDSHFNLGAKIWEWTHPGQVQAERDALAPNNAAAQLQRGIFSALDQEDADLGFYMGAETGVAAPFTLFAKP